LLSTLLNKQGTSSRSPNDTVAELGPDRLPSPGLPLFVVSSSACTRSDGRLEDSSASGSTTVSDLQNRFGLSAELTSFSRCLKERRQGHGPVAHSFRRSADPWRPVCHWNPARHQGVTTLAHEPRSPRGCHQEPLHHPWTLARRRLHHLGDQRDIQLEHDRTAVGRWILGAFQPGLHPMAPLQVSLDLYSLFMLQNGTGINAINCTRLSDRPLAVPAARWGSPSALISRLKAPSPRSQDRCLASPHC